VDDGHGVTGDDPARLHHPQVRARRAVRGEPFDPLRLAHPVLEGLAGDARARHLDHQRDRAVPDLPALPDLSAGDVQAGRPQVLPEQSRGDPAPELAAPPRGVLVGVGVDRLVATAVVGPVALGVAADPERPDLDPPADGPLVDRGGVHRAERIGQQLMDDGDRSHSGVVRLPHPTSLA
jgi:hypothetical protein